MRLHTPVPGQEARHSWLILRHTKAPPEAHRWRERTRLRTSGPSVSTALPRWPRPSAAPPSGVTGTTRRTKAEDSGHSACRSLQSGRGCAHTPAPTARTQAARPGTQADLSLLLTNVSDDRKQLGPGTGGEHSPPRPPSEPGLVLPLPLARQAHHHMCRSLCRPRHLDPLASSRAQSSGPGGSCDSERRLARRGSGECLW